MNTGNRIPELDGLRGIAILIIIIWHYVNNQLFHSNYEIINFIILLTRTFWNGVDLFFILSGFLIGGILLKNKSSENYFRTFYLRRIFRIFPLYYLVLSLFIILIFLIPQIKSIPYLFNGSIPIWSYAVFCQNYLMISEQSFGAGWLTVTWSLAIEEQFYLLLPVLIFFLNRKFALIAVICLIILSPIFRYFSSTDWFLGYLSFQCRMDALFTGVLIAMLLEKEKFVNSLKSKQTIVYLIFFILSASMIYVSLNNKIDKFHFMNYTLFIMFFSTLLIVSLLFKDGLIARIMRNRMLRKIGTVSYGIYLFHLIVIYFMLWFFNEIGIGRVNNFNVIIIAAVSFVITYSLAFISYRYFESKLIRYSHKYVY